MQFCSTRSRQSFSSAVNEVAQHAHSGLRPGIFLAGKALLPVNTGPRNIRQWKEARLAMPGEYRPAELFPRGAAFQGLIVWRGMESIPDEFAHGNILPATVVVYDQFNDAYPFQVSLWTDRRRVWSPEKCKRNSRAPLLILHHHDRVRIT
jgi:hypothetical protein